MRNKIVLPLLLVGQMQMATANSGQDLIIKKLNQVLLNLAPQDTSKQAITLRLADLYAERARQNTMQGVDDGANSSAGKNDRLEAIRLYKSALKNLKGEEEFKVNLQIAHLLSIVGQTADSQKAYTQLLVKEESPKLRSQIFVALGELNFKQRDFKTATVSYKKALEITEIQNKGYVLYRLSWCYFNLGEKQNAFKTTLDVLSDSKNLVRSYSGQGGGIDLQFKEEVARDMVTFMAQAEDSAIQIETIKNLSPEQSITSNAYYLASELERLGRRKKSIEIWNQYKQIESKPDLRMEAMVHLAQLYFEDNLKTESLAEYEGTIQLWTQVQADETKSKELKSRIKNYIASWTSVEKTKPSQDLMKAYAIYISAFPKEEDVVLAAAGLEKERKNWQISIAHYQNLFGIAQTMDGKEKALLGQLEVAELSKDSEIKVKAYEQYLTNFPNGKKSAEVQYQKAYLVYEKENYDQASLLFLNLALANISSAEASSLQSKAADLALDALVLAKKEDQLNSFTTKLAAKFPNRSQEFLSVSRRAQLNTVATLINSNTDSQAAWNALLQTDIRGSTDSEKMAFYKNKMILAERLKNFSEVRSASDQLLLLKPNAQDQALALKLKSWSCEMVLDLNCAYEAAAQISDATEEHALRLGVLADLSGQPSQKHFDQFIGKSKDERKKAILAAKLIFKGKNPENDYIKYKTILKLQADLDENTLLKIYALQKNSKWILSQIDFSKYAPTTRYGIQLKRIFFFEDLNNKLSLAQQHELKTQSEAALKKSLQARIKWVESLEVLANKSIESKDWASQVYALESYRKELERVYQDILSLPIPEGLAPEQQQEYMILLTQTSAPFKTKSEDIKLKLNEFWAQASQPSIGSEAWLLDIEKTENQRLASAAPEMHKHLFGNSNIVAQKSETPALVELQRARDLVSQKPLELASLKHLASLEEKLGRTEMVEYLNSRISDLETTAK